MKKNILFILTFFFIVSTVSAQVLNSPVLVTPPDRAFVTILPVVLDWEDVQGADCYLIEITTDTTTENKISDTCNASYSSYHMPLEETELNTTYFWRVAAHNGSGWSGFSAYFQFTTAPATSLGGVENLIDGVIDLISDGAITGNQGNMLNHRLEQAQQELELDNTEQAILYMFLFEARVLILRFNDRITQETADALIFSANGVIDLISGDSPNQNPVTLEHLTTPLVYSITQNYPNPFNPSTTIEYSIPENASVSLKVYDMLGKEVADLVNKSQDKGTYIINWDASNYSSGIYFYRIQAKGLKGNFADTKKMILTK